MIYLNCSILADFRIMRLQERQAPEKTRKVSLAQGRVVRPVSLSRYYSSVQPLYESHKGDSGASPRPRARPEKLT